jgi:tetratricopeptide (TPR) repeat protein
MPLVPEGPVRRFFERLHALHFAAGQPSMRELQRLTRAGSRPRGINPTTIHDALSAPRLARLEVVQAVVRGLGGDVDEFTTLWEAARAAANIQAGNDPPQRTENHLGVPRELPPDVYAFTGRGGALAFMHDVLAAVDERPAVGIAAVSGTAGVGKTALAVHWAHQVAGQFPDGQLYVDLRGYDPHAPLAPGDALAQFLRALGTGAPDIPYEVAERAARYRSLLADRRVLVVLDNAGAAEQVRPLLPGSPSCFVLVTSRDSLGGLVARNGARRIEIDLLPAEDALALLNSLVGARTEIEPVAARILVDQCTRLPLALRVAAELVIERPSSSLADLAAELADEERRLDVLDAGADERTGIRKVFSWSYRHLAPDAARLFRLLGLNPGADIDGRAAAALAGGHPTNADPTTADPTGEEPGGEEPGGDGLAGTRRLLDVLARAHLVERGGRDRYAMHDLLRAYAADLAGREETAADRQAAVTRLLDYHLATSAAAMDAAFPAERHSRPRVHRGDTRTAAVDDPAGARQWLDGERAALVSAVGYAARGGWPRHAVMIAATLARYLQNGGHHTDAVAVHTAALHAAQGLDDRLAASTALANLAVVWWRWGNYDRAADTCREALAAFEAIGDRAGMARMLTNLGAVYWQQGRYEEAAASSRQAVTRFVDLGDQRGEARALDNLGSVLHRQGRDELAAEHHEQALTILREIGDRAGEAQALTNLGAIWLRKEPERAENNLQLVLRIAADIGSSSQEASAHNDLGDVYRVRGDQGTAEIQYKLALGLAEQIDDRYESARALAGLGHTRVAARDPDLAQRYWRRALTIYEEIGVPEAAELRTLLGARTGAGRTSRDGCDR